MADPYSRNREEIAKLEIGHTTIGRLVATILVCGFLLILYSIPIIQSVSDVKAFRDGGRTTPIPEAFSIIRGVSSSLFEFIHATGSITGRIFAANRVLKSEIDDYETRLENTSVVSKYVLPSTQYVLSGLLGAGNEKAVCGNDGWLFYRPDVEYLIGPGFMEQRKQLHRIRNESVQPDPIRAICALKNDLNRRGIDLLILPVPVKPMIHPEHLYGGFKKSDHPLHNPSYRAFVDTLKNRGIMVFDFGEVFATIHKKITGSLYFKTDTHWLPETMHAAAESLSSFLVDSGYVKPTARIPFQTERTIVANSGDITEMLRLPSDQLLYPPEEVSIRRIFMPDGTPWRPDRSSEILVLGDSFSNIFSLADMGWGESAGFVEQLSYELGQTVDAVLRNDNGSFATRKVIYDESARGEDRLEGKRIVLYQFAVRELSQGDWEVYESFVSNETVDVFFCPDAGAEEIVSAKIKSISPIPRPFSVPYKDHIVTLHLFDVRTESGDDIPMEAVVYMWSMRNNELTAAASLRPGQSIHLRLSAWSDVSDNLERINRGELMDIRLLSADPCWGDLL